MKKTFSSIALAVVVLFSSCVETEKIEKPYNQGLNITPLPLELTQGTGKFELTKNTSFVVNNDDAKKVADFFASKIQTSTGYKLSSQNDKPASNYISLGINPELNMKDEGYTLVSDTEGVKIEAKTVHGLFYGMQTVMQLLPAEIESTKKIDYIAWTIPAVSIKDEPNYNYRGLHLDACRHFIDIEFIKKQLDILAMFKINTFHWHLTEDQGWRIEIKKHPKLTEIGATRTEGEGHAYGPYFYTQDQVKEIVAYAKERFIEVIPEIELPGHAVAAVSAYPELSCTGENIDVRNYWGVAADVFCAGNEASFQFLEDVIAEVIPLFESEYFHIGGDECPKDRWEKCSKCQARIKELGIKGDKMHTAEEKLQSYFVQRMGKFLEKHNKKMIGWDEILEGGLAPSATVMSWRGDDMGIMSANMGHDIIMTPNGVVYLDHYQGEDKLLPVTIGGFTPLKKTYDYDPAPAAIAVDKRHHILGAQVNSWAEYKYNDQDREHDLYPRAIALAELTWTAKAKKNYADFERRLDNIRVRLDMHNVNYYMPMPETKGYPSANFMAFTDQISLDFSTTEPVKLVYTTDGSEPSLSSSVYMAGTPLVFTENTNLKIRSVLVSDKMGKIRTIVLDKQTYEPAIEKPTDAQSGLKAEYIKGVARSMNDLEGKTADETEYVASPKDSKYRIANYGEIYDKDFTSTILTGYINIAEDGVYYFSTDHELWVGDKLFITNEEDNMAARRFSRNDKSVALAKGYHPIKIVRFGATFGGWPTQWSDLAVSIRKEKEEKFQLMGADFFK